MNKRLRNLLNRMLFRIEQLSLQSRLNIAYVVIILLPSILISIYIFNEFYGNYLRDVERSNENALEIERININNNIAAMERAAQLTISDEDVLEYLGQTTEPSTSELIAFSRNTVPNILRIQYNNPTIEHIRIFTRSETLFELWPVFHGERRINNEPWYDEVMVKNGMEHWMIQREDKEIIRYSEEGRGEQPKISLSKVIQYPQGNHVGIIQVDMLLMQFFPNMFNTLQDEQAQLLVMDGKGELYTNPAHSFLAEIGLTDTFIKEQFNQLLTTDRQSAEFMFNGIPFLLAHTYIERIDAYMLNVVSLENVYRDLNKTRNYILLANIVLIVILAVATYIINSIILKKLHILASSMKKVRQGDFHIELAVRGGGEVGELAHHFRKMLSKINELIAEAVNKQAASKEAELKTLRNQIDQHFLYNTLENIKMLAEIENQPVISDALTSLGGLMRYNLKWTSEYVSLREEINYITNYIAIMNVRFDEKIMLQLDIPPEYLNQELLKMSLQPVVENAVKHGLKSGEMTITIKASAIDGDMVIEMIDDGIGMTADVLQRLNRKFASDADAYADTPDPLSGGTPAGSVMVGGSSPGTGIGLHNVHQRIQMFYGKEYGLRVESKEGKYTRVIMRIPYFILTGGLS